MSTDRIKTRTPYDVKHMLLRHYNVLSAPFYVNPSDLIVSGNMTDDMLETTFYAVERRIRNNVILADVFSREYGPNNG